MLAISVYREQARSYVHEVQRDWLLVILLALFLSAGASALAATKAAPAELKRGQLKELQQRIGALQRDLAKSEETQAYAADQLKETESAISAARRGLRELGQQRGEVQAELLALQQQARRLEAQIVSQQGQLGRLLYRQYVNGQTDALQMILSGDDPNQSARDLHYVSLLSRAQADLLGVLHNTLAGKQRLADAARAKRDELSAIEQRRQAQHAALLAQQLQRKDMLVKLAGKIKAQRREIGALKRDENRLGRLIEGLARIVAKPVRTLRSAKARSGTPGVPPRPSQPTRSDPRNELTPDAISFAGDFAKLRGHLRLPVRGELANRFGKPRAASGATWKGLFIRAAEGGEVQAVAPGRVVFADWLRGFGNLLILDHGDSFLTVYGNNQSLFRQVGDTVRSGDVVAAVGNSGGNPESGLYFELRQHGLAVDPLKWIRLN